MLITADQPTAAILTALLPVMRHACRWATRTTMRKYGDQLLKRDVLIPSWYEVGEQVWENRVYVDIQRLAHALEEACVGWKEFDVLREAFWNSDAFQQTLNNTADKLSAAVDSLIVADHVRDLFLDYCYHTPSLLGSTPRWRRSNFNPIAEEFVRSLTEGTSCFEIIAPVFGIWIGQPEIRVNDTARLFHPEGVLRLELSETWAWTLHPPTQEFKATNTYVAVAGEVPVGEVVLPEQAAAELGEWSTALRLVVGGSLHVGNPILLPAPGTLRRDWWRTGDRRLPQKGEMPWRVAEFAAGHVGDLLAARDAVRQLKERHPIALLNYVASAMRSDAIGFLLHLVIALENLLVPNSRDELSFRFALHGALLLGDSEVEREDVHRTLRHIYKTRGARVHGSEGTLSQSEQTLSLRAEEFTRRLLLLAAKHSRKSWMKMISTLPLMDNRRNSLDDQDQSVPDSDASLCARGATGSQRPSRR